MAKRKVRKKATADATPEMIAKAKKMKAEGKSYKDIAKALGYKYDKAAWNLLNPGPTGRHRGDKAGGRPSGTVQKGKREAGKPRAAEGSVEARRTGRKRGKTGTAAPVESPKESTQDKPSEEVSGKSVTLGRPIDRPVARPFEPPANGSKEEVRAVPKPGATRRKRK